MRYFIVTLILVLGFTYCPIIEYSPITGIDYAYAAKTPGQEADAARAAKKQASMVLQMYQEFEKIASSQNKLFQSMAASLFKICALIGIIMMGVHAVLSRAGVEDIIKEFIIYLLFAGVCFIAIEHYDTWTKWFMEVEGNIANRINSSVTLNSGKYNKGTSQFGLGPIEAGFDFLILTLNAVNVNGIGDAVLAVLYLILGIIILGILAMMTARLIVVLCETLIAINLGVVLLGLGAWSSTREYAISHFKFCGATFMKILSMHFIIYIGLALLHNTWSMMAQKGLAKELTLGFVCLITAMVIIIYIISQSLPQTIAGMISGVNTSSGIGFRAALAGTGIAAAAMTAAKVAANTPMAVAAAAASGVQNARGARAAAAAEGKPLSAAQTAGSFFKGAASSVAGAVTEGVRDKRRASNSFITKTTQSMQDNASAMGKAQSWAASSPENKQQRMADLHKNYGNTLYQHGRGGNEYGNAMNSYKNSVEQKEQTQAQQAKIEGAYGGNPYSIGAPGQANQPGGGNPRGADQAAGKAAGKQEKTADRKDK